MVDTHVQPDTLQPEIPQPELPQPEPNYDFQRTEFYIPCRPSIVARVMGRRVTVYVGMDYQLWRIVSIEEIRREGLDTVPGQYTVATSNHAVSWLRAHCPRGPDLDRMVEMYAGKITNYWEYLHHWREVNRKDEDDEPATGEAVSGDEV